MNTKWRKLLHLVSVFLQHKIYYFLKDSLKIKKDKNVEIQIIVLNLIFQF